MGGQLAGRVALVTGAGSGIGKASALLLAHEGAQVGVLGRTQDQLEAAVAEIRQNGGQAMPLLADVSQPDQMERAVQALVEAWGRIDIVFANAGINGVWAPVEDITPEEWDQVLGINLKGTFLTVKYTVPHLKKRGGSIVICSSVQGTRVFSVTGTSAYASSKAAQVAFAKKLALELGRFRVRANVVCPGWIISEIQDNTWRRNVDAIHRRVEYRDGRIPLTDGKPGTAEQVAQVVLFLASDASSHVTGTEIWVDGGESLVQG